MNIIVLCWNGSYTIWIWIVLYKTISYDMNQWFKKYYTLCFNCIIWYQFLEFDLSYERISIIARLLYTYCNIHHVIPQKLNIKFNIWWYLWFILYLMYKRIFLMSKSILSIDYNTVTGTAHLQGKKTKYDGTAFV